MSCRSILRCLEWQLANRLKEQFLWSLTIRFSEETNAWLIMFLATCREDKKPLTKQVYLGLLDVSVYYTWGEVTCCVRSCVFSWKDLFLLQTTGILVCGWFSVQHMQLCKSHDIWLWTWEFFITQPFCLLPHSPSSLWTQEIVSGGKQYLYCGISIKSWIFGCKSWALQKSIS